VVHWFAVDAHNHFVEMPSRARPRPLSSKCFGEGWATRQHRAPHGLIGDVESALGERVFDISIAERDPKVEPYGVLDDRGREAVAQVRDPAHRWTL
jgi:hypothetical protein